MKIAFVGVKRKYTELPEGYRDSFDKYHLELPWYYAEHGGNDVTITTVDTVGEEVIEFPSGGKLRRINEAHYKSTVKLVLGRSYDLVIHFRKWYDDLFCKNALNVLISQDHSFSHEWEENVADAICDKKLYGILCFPTWHEEYIQNFFKMSGRPREVRTISGLTLGVDTEIYKPLQKDPYMMLWASDPGRGLDGAVRLILELWFYDKRFRLVVTYPDYVKERVCVSHPAIEVRHGVRNGPELWNLFNIAGIVPYTSTFMEPSSRVHRQGQAAGCLVLYPPKKGTPSHLIQDGVTGYVRPINDWYTLIVDSIGSNRSACDEIRSNARNFAVSENWQVQAERFNRYFEGLV